MARRTSSNRKPFVRLERLEDRNAPALFTQLSSQTSNQLHNNGFVGSGDWNKDGLRDIVLANYGDSDGLGGAIPGNTITFAYGQGDGKFGSFSSQAVGPGNDLVSFIAVGDLNNDGNPDIVTANTNNNTKGGTMTVFLGTAAGAFNKTAGSPISSGGNRASWVGIADFDKDGKMDVAVVNLGEESGATGRSVNIYKGDGAGGLTLRDNNEIPQASGVPTAGAIADFNNDTWPDIAVTFANVPPEASSPQINGSIRVFINNTDGTLPSFAAALEFDSGGPLPISIVAGDYSGDGFADLVVANAGDPDNNGGYVQFGLNHSIGTLTNGGGSTGTFGPTTTYTSGFNSAFAVALSDLNLDGKLDIAICDLGKPASIIGGSQKGGLAVYLGKTTGPGFLHETSSPYVNANDGPQYIVIDSFNSNTDSTPDVVMVGLSNTITTFLNTSVPASSTTTTLAAAPVSPSTFGNTITLTAAVTTATGSPTGTVTFFNGAATLGTGTISTVGGNQIATFAANGLNAGSYTFAARYEASGGFATSKSSDLGYTINKAASTTALNVNPSSATQGNQITFTATVDSAGGIPTGTVAFFDNGVQIGSGTIATVVGQQQASFQTTTLSIGTHPITAMYSGATNYNTSTSSGKSVTINSNAPVNTSTTLLSSPNPSLFGEPITFTATVGAVTGTPSGSVTFTENGATLGSGILSNVGGSMQATFTTSLTLGLHPIIANYQGTTSFNPSSSAIASQQVNSTPTSTSIALTGTNPFAFEAPVKFTATVSATAGTPSGSVAFFDNNVQIGGPIALFSNAGQFQAVFTTSNLTVGSHPITAKFLGSTGQDISTSSSKGVTISAVGTTTVALATPNPVTFGQSVLLTASIAPSNAVTPSPTGTVTFKNGTTILGTGTLATAGGVTTATLNTSLLPIGIQSITAEYAGDATFSTSTSSSASVTVNSPPSQLVGYREFGVGAGTGLNDTAQFYNPDATLRFVANLFPGFSGGVRTTSADFNGDGIADLVVGTGPGAASRVIIIDGKTQVALFSIQPFESTFVGGVFVSAGDITGDGLADLVISPDEGGGPRVSIFNGKGFVKIADFYGIDDPNFRGGARTAVADITGDGKGDVIVAAGFGGGPRVATFNGATLTSSGGAQPFGDFFMFEQTLRNGIYIAAGDVDGDGFADIIGGGGPGGGPRVFALSGKDLVNSNGKQTQVANFFAGNQSNRGGIRLVARDLDGDTRTDIVTGDGNGAGSRVTGYLGKNILANGTPPEAFAFNAFSGFIGGVFVG